MQDVKSSSPQGVVQQIRVLAGNRDHRAVILEIALGLAAWALIAWQYPFEPVLAKYGGF